MGKKRILILFSVLFSLLLFSACKGKEDEVKKVKDLEFTVVEEADIPESLKKLVNEKKKQAFTMSYADGDYLYIVVGYGEQPSGGFSISVDELFLGEEAVYIHTNLIGPSEKDLVTTAYTYPYVVVKTEYLDKIVEFR